MSSKPVFIIRTIISDIDNFRALAEQAVRLKKYGRVEMAISALSGKARYEIPEGGNAWHEYASHNPSLHKFFPHPKIAPFIPADYVEKNRQGLAERLEVTRELGLGAAFWAGEPAFIPDGFFEAYPHLRGPRVDHPRRSRHEEFALCIDHEETLEMYSWMMAELVKVVPELRTFCFKTNDAGSGMCWAARLYSGPNGPTACRHRSIGQRVAGFMQSLRDGASAGGAEVDVFMGHFFEPGEASEISLLLPDGCYMDGDRTSRKSSVSIGCSMLNACYPVKALFNPLPIIRSASAIKADSEQTVFLNARVFYHRSEELTDVWTHALDVVEKCIAEPVSGLRATLDRLHEHCCEWVGPDQAEDLTETLVAVSEAMKFQSAALSPLSTIYLGVSLRHITRPLVPAPDRLSQEEESYWLSHVFNIWQDEARDDYLDLHGGRPRSVSIDALDPFVHRLLSLAGKLEDICSQSNDELLAKMPKALRVHASVLRSCGNFHRMQMLRDRNQEKLSQVSRPSKDSTWTGDTDLLSMNALIRNELDNTHELIDVLEDGGMEVVAHAKAAADEDTFLLGPDLVDQLKRKCKIMRRHWLDGESYLTSPCK